MFADCSKESPIAPGRNTCRIRHNAPRCIHAPRRRSAIMRAVSHAVERLENRVLFTTYLGAAAQAQSSAPLGINLSTETSYNTQALFFDVHKEMDDWRQASSPYGYLPSNELTATNYPLENAYTETNMIGYPMGTYTLVYSSTGNASLSAASMGSIIPNTATTVTVNGVLTTTVRVQVQADSNDPRLLLYANNIDAGDQISNLHFYMPGYTAGQTPPELNPNVATRLGPFGTIRLMDLLDTNYSTVTNWADRTTPENFSYVNNAGIAYEDAVAMANQLQENLWWNIPVQATQAYMADLAELIKYGSDGVNPYTGPAGSGGSNPVPATGAVYPGLDSNLKVYIEFGNELWHEGLPDDTYNIDQGYANKNEFDTNLPTEHPSWFNTANSAGEFAFSAEQNVYELRQTYTAFSSVYGASLASQIGFVFAADSSNTIFSQAAFDYMNDMTAQWGAPSTWITAYAVPTYINVDSSVDVAGMTLNQLFSDLDSQITTTFASTISADAQFAASYSTPGNTIALFSYEGGQALIPDNENATVKNEAQDDPRMGQFYTQLLNEWYSLGGSLLLPFEFAETNTPSGDWGLLQTASDPGSPKWDAVIQRLVPVGDANLDGVADANDLAILEANYGLTGNIYWQQGDLNGDGIVNAADFTLLGQNAGPSVGQQAQAFLATTAQPQLLPETNIIGTSGSYEGGVTDTFANVFDGDLTTYFDAPSAGQALTTVPNPTTNDEVGLNLGSPYSITSIRFAPRVGYENRMVGGVFLASNYSDFASAVAIYTITATPPDGYTTEEVSVRGTYQYVMYVGPANSYGNVSELQFYGEPPITTGTPTITPATTNEGVQSASGLVITASDPTTVAYQISGITNGTLYQNDGVTPITNGEFITVAQATSGLKFTPVANLYSTAGTTLSFSAEASSTDDVGGLGGSVATASITVNRVAHSPTITNATTTQSTQTTSGLVITPNALDTADANLSYQITGITSGTLFLSNGTTPVTNGSFITAAQGTAGLDFTPTPGLTSPGSSFGFSIQASVDGTLGGLGGSVVSAKVTVNPPVVTGTPTITPATTKEDTQSTTGLVITAADSNTVSYLITGITNGTLYQNDGATPITNGQYITLAQGTAGLKFTPGLHLFGPTMTFSFSVEASTTAGSAGLSGGTATASVTVKRAAHTPTITTASTTQGTQTVSGLVITPNTQDTSDTSLAYEVTGITNGTLFLSNGTTPVINGQFVTAAQGMAGLLFTPSANLTSPSSSFGFSIQASTNGTVACLGGSVVPATVTVSAAAVGKFGGVASANTTTSYNGLTSHNFTAVFDGSTSTYFDAPTASANYVQLDLGSPQTITEIAYAPRQSFESRMTGGIFEASNDPTFTTGVVTLYTVTAAPADGLTTRAVSPGGTYEYVRYISPAGSYGNIAEMQVFGPGGTGSAITFSTGTGSGSTTPVQLVPAATSGTAGSWDGLSSDAYTAVFDGNVNTYFDAASANGVYVQADLGSAQTISEIAYAPRAGFEYRMVGGIFEASNDPTFTSGVVTLYTVSGTPADGLTPQAVSPGGTFRYVRYVAPAGSYGNIAELQIFGPGSSSGTGTGGGSTTPVQLVPAATSGTAGSWDGLSSDAYTAVFDGNVNTYFDAASANGVYVQADLGSAQTISEIAYAPRAGFEYRMVGGIFEASNDPTFTSGVVTLYTVSGAPADGLTPQPVSPGGTFRYVRYVAPAGSYGNIAELQIFGPGSSSGTGTGGGTPTSALLVPASTSGTTGSYDGLSSDSYTAVFDGNVNTYLDAPNANGDYVQADLGAQHTLTSISYAPRAGFEYRVVGGYFEASNDPTFAAGVVTLYTINSTAVDGLTNVSVTATGTYQYVRYVAPGNSFGNIAEMQIFGY
jgi:hypothetical protein